MIRVQVFQPDGQPMMRSFSKNEVLIGRKPNNDIILAGQDVSGTHACLQVENGRVTLVDLGSTNGTYVNSQRVQVSAQLSPADEIKISVFTLHVSLGDDRSASVDPPSQSGSGLSAAAARPTASSEPGRRGAAASVDDLPPPVRRSTTTPVDDLPPSVRRSTTPAPSDDLPPPVRRSTTPAPSDDLPPPVRRSAAPLTSAADDDLPPPVRRSVTPAPRDDLPPPVRRGGEDTLNPVRPTRPATAAPDDPDGPPVVARARPTSTTRQPEPVAVAVEAADLEQAWADPTVRRIIIAGLQRVEVERDGVCLPLARGFSSAADLGERLAALCGRPVLRESPTECVLASGTSVQAILDGDRGPHVVITRPRSKRPGGLDALVQERALPALAAELLAGCVRAHLPVLLVARAGVSAAPLLMALIATLEASTGLVRGLPAPAVAPRGCVAIDAGHGSGHMAAAVRLLLATEVAVLAVDEPEPAAFEECAWACAEGRGLLIGVRAESLEQALARARASGTPGSGPAIPYALAAVLGPPRPRAAVPSPGAQERGAFTVTRLVELRGTEHDPSSIHEIFGIGRRGELIPIAVPAVLGELTQRGVHIAPELFTPA